MVKYFNKLLCQVFIKKINHPYNKWQNETTKWVQLDLVTLYGGVI